jgi:hypothetical protein
MFDHLAKSASENVELPYLVLDWKSGVHKPAGLGRIGSLPVFH